MTRALVVFLCCCSLLCSQVSAFSVPVGPAQRAIAKLITDKAIKRGFAPNDPRLVQTLSRTSGVAGDIAGYAAATVVAGAVTAPAWVTVALALGVGITVGLAVNGIVSWIFPDEAEAASVTVKHDGTQPSSAALLQGGPYWLTTIAGVYGSDARSAIQTAVSINWPSDATSNFEIGTCSDSTNPVKTSCLVTRVNKSTGYKQIGYAAIGATYNPAGAPANCAAGYVYRNGACVAVPAVAAPDTAMPIQNAVTELAPEELAKPANPKLVSTIADQLWRRAASLPGYDGLPYVAADPITEAEAEAQRQANPSAWPTVQDLVSPQPAANSPWKLPVDASATSQDSGTALPPVNPAASSPLQNLGADPGIGSPPLEPTPTARQILQPLLDLLPDFRGFVVPSHQATCPKPTFDVLEKSIVMAAHCDIAEEQRAALQAVMAAVWALTAAFIILRA